MNESSRTALIGVVVVAALIAGGSLYYKMFFGSKTIDANDRNITKIEAETQKKKLELREIEALLAERERLDDLRAKIEKVRMRLPSDKQAPEFLKTLIENLRRTGVIQQIVKPEKLIDNEQYTEIPWSINAYGRYHEVGQFLAFIEQNPDRFMRLKSLLVENNNKRPSIHPVKMEIATFMFNE